MKCHLVNQNDFAQSAGTPSMSPSTMAPRSCSWLQVIGQFLSFERSSASAIYLLSQMMFKRSSASPNRTYQLCTMNAPPSGHPLAHTTISMICNVTAVNRFCLVKVSITSSCNEAVSRYYCRRLTTCCAATCTTFAVSKCTKPTWMCHTSS